MESARLPCCTILSRLPRKVSARSRYPFVPYRRLYASKRVLQLVDQFDREAREVVDEIERVLDLVGDAGGQLAERGELLGLHQTVLRGAQILQRLRQFLVRVSTLSNSRTFSMAIAA